MIGFGDFGFYEFRDCDNRLVGHFLTQADGHQFTFQFVHISNVLPDYCAKNGGGQDPSSSEQPRKKPEYMNHWTVIYLAAGLLFPSIGS